MAERLKPGGIFLINTPYSADEVWARLPQEVQAVLNQKQARLYVINAAKIARDEGLADDGYRLIVNCNRHGGQEVYHIHMHLLGGRPLGPMLAHKG